MHKLRSILIYWFPDGFIGDDPTSRRNARWLWRLIILPLILASTIPALAGVSCSLPFTLTNGTLADATQVMANYNALVSCLTNAAAAGANNDITSLSGITSPLSPSQGGSNVYIGNAPSAVGNNITISTTIPSGFTNANGSSVFFVSPITNTGAVTLSVGGQQAFSVFKTTQAGPVQLTGSELFNGQIVYATLDNTEWQIITTSGLASLTATAQTLSGGANVTSANLGTFNAGNTLSSNCGLGPLQTFSNNGAMTLAAPTLDGSCVLLDGNTGSAGSITFTGFTTNANTGESLDTVNAHQFMINIVRINGISTYWIKALQ